MGLLGWLQSYARRRNATMPNPAADFLGAATLPKPDPLPAVVIPPKDTRGKPVSDKCAAMVAKWEGFRDAAYLCPADVWTIGYGTTRWPDGRRVKAGETITRQVADSLLRRSLGEFAGEVDRMAKVPLSDGERSALISFAYNVGAPSLGSSTLLRLLNAEDRAGAAEQFRRWNKAGGRELSGLTRRRAEEAAMFRGVPG